MNNVPCLRHTDTPAALQQKSINRQFIYVLAILFFLTSGFVRAEPLNYISLTTGLDNDNGRLFDAYLDIALTEELRLSLGTGASTSKNTESSFTTRSQQVTISGYHKQPNLSALNWSLSYQTWGGKDTIETRDSNISIGYSFNNSWHFSIDYETGQLALFIKPQFSRKAVAINSDRHAWRFSTSYSHQTGSFWLSVLQRKYDKNLPAISQHGRIQRAIKHNALSQAYTLSKDELTLGYEWFFDTLDLGTDYHRLVSVIDSQRSHYFSIFSRFYVNQHLSINLRIEQEIDASSTLYTAGVGFSW